MMRKRNHITHIERKGIGGGTPQAVAKSPAIDKNEAKEGSEKTRNIKHPPEDGVIKVVGMKPYSTKRTLSNRFIIQEGVVDKTKWTTLREVVQGKKNHLDQNHISHRDLQKESQ